MATQRARKTAPRAAETSGSNAFFTMGLVTVIALLIVGWVMTQGGFSQLTSEGQGVLNLLGDNQPAEGTQSEAVAVPTSVPSIIVQNTPATPAAQPITASEREALKMEYEKLLAQEQTAMNEQINEIKLNYQKQMQELQLRIEFLEMENQRLRGE